MTSGPAAFGRERAGTLHARVRGKAGTCLTLRFGKELDETGRVRYNMHPDPEAPDGFRFSPRLPERLDYFSLRVPLHGHAISITKNGRKVDLTCSTLK